MDTASSTPSGSESVVHVTTVEPSAALPSPHDMILPAAPAVEFQKRNSSYGALISIIIILAIVVVGAFYSWGERIEKNNPTFPVVEEMPGATTTTTAP